jgi:hypothetical protein
MPEKLRLRFEKTGRAIYISHLDLMRTMQRVFLRADCPLKYSEGFNPHALISILLPLSVGVGSVCELMDFQLREEVDLAALPERLTAVMPEGIRALEAYPGGRKVRELKWLRVTGRYEYDNAAPADMAEKLRAKGAKVVEMDLTRTDVSYAVTEAFRCGKIVLACATYDGFLFPPMENLLAHLKTKNFQSRTVGLMENGTWAPMAAKLMRAELEGMKNITVCENVVTIRSAANDAAKAQMDALADELVLK